MEDNQLPEGPEQSGCVNCGNGSILEGHPTKLCENCREQFIKYPIPLGIKIFAGAILLALLLSMFTFPKHLSLGLHLARGKKYENSHQYKMAQHEFEQVVQKVPDNIEANGHLLIAAFYNMDFNTCYKVSQGIEKQPFDDEELLSRINSLGDKFGEYVPDDSLVQFMQTMTDTTGKVPDAVFHAWLTKHPDNVFGMYSYANNLMEAANYAVCDSVLQIILKIDPQYTPALRMLAGSQRDQQQFDEAIGSCNRILLINKDAAYVYAAKARIYLKQKKDAIALEQALKAVELDKTDPFNTATLAIAYHFNDQPVKRDAVIKEARVRNDSSEMAYMQYAIDIIDKKENFRN